MWEDLKEGGGLANRYMGRELLPGKRTTGEKVAKVPNKVVVKIGVGEARMLGVE